MMQPFVNTTKKATQHFAVLRPILAWTARTTLAAR